MLFYPYINGANEFLEAPVVAFCSIFSFWKALVFDSLPFMEGNGVVQ